MAYRQQPQRTFRRAEHQPRFAAAQAPVKSQDKLEEEAQGIMGQIGGAVMGGLRAIDDSTQAFARDHLLRLPTDGTPLEKDAFLSDTRHALGKSVFKARRDYEGDNTIYKSREGTMNDNIGLGLSRALQGGAVVGLTAAGIKLADMATQFGSQADYPEPNQLSL